MSKGIWCEVLTPQGREKTVPSYDWVDIFVEGFEEGVERLSSLRTKWILIQKVIPVHDADFGTARACRPVIVPDLEGDYQFGGNFAFSTHPAFQAISELPLPIYDRVVEREDNTSE